MVMEKYTRAKSITESRDPTIGSRYVDSKRIGLQRALQAYEMNTENLPLAIWGDFGSQILRGSSGGVRENSLDYVTCDAPPWNMEVLLRSCLSNYALTKDRWTTPV